MSAENKLLMMKNKIDSKKLQLRSVLDKACRAYIVARKRAMLQKSMAGREEAKVLAVDYPDFYALRGTEKYLEFIGMTADEIIEVYVHDIGGKTRGSQLWHRIAHIVITKGEREYQERLLRNS
jgi:hypothetical protein